MRQLKCKIAEQFRHLLMQVDKNSVDIEILLDLETKKTVRLKELILIGGVTPDSMSSSVIFRWSSLKFRS